jgi:hypothetical protein
MEESQIIEIWDIFKEYVPEKNREVAAGHYVDFLVGKDVETSVLEGLMGYDPHLDTAIELVTGEEAEDDDDVYDEGGWGGEDEDY